jgi:hypothetical protein
MARRRPRMEGPDPSMPSMCKQTEDGIVYTHCQRVRPPAERGYAETAPCDTCPQPPCEASKRRKKSNAVIDLIVAINYAQRIVSNICRRPIWLSNNNSTNSENIINSNNIIKNNHNMFHHYHCSTSIVTLTTLVQVKRTTCSLCVYVFVFIFCIRRYPVVTACHATT